MIVSFPSIGGSSSGSTGPIDWADVINKPTLGDLAALNQVNTPEIIDLAVTSAKVAANAITSEKIANDAVTHLKIATNAVQTSNINAGAVTHAKLASNAVESTNILDGAVTNAKLASNSVTGVKIQDGTITAAKLGFTVPGLNLVTVYSDVSGSQLALNDTLAQHFIEDVNSNRTLISNPSTLTLANNNAILYTVRNMNGSNPITVTFPTNFFMTDAGIQCFTQSPGGVRVFSIPVGQTQSWYISRHGFAGSLISIVPSQVRQFTT